MIDDEARELRQRGIREAKAGNKDIAREILQQSIRIDPRSEAAWLWLASVARDNNERVFCLQKLLEINPVNEAGQKALAAALKMSSQQATQQQPQPSSSAVPRVGVPAAKPPPADIMSQAPGVPVPMPDRIAEAQKHAEELARDYLEPLPTTIRWKHKTGNRAGERDIIVFRTYIAVGITVAVLVLIVGLVVLVQTNDNVREIVLGPSATPTPSPTITPTNTPGLTPTPSATPRLTPTPSATPPRNLLVPSPPALPRATEIYPEILERAVYDSVMLLQGGQVSRALPTLAFERRLNNDTRFDPNPYYYEAMGLLAQRRYTEALATLDSAMERVGERPDDFWVTPFIDSGYAQIYWAMAQGETDPTRRQETLELMNDHAQAAVAGDDRLLMPYLILARAAAQQGAYGDAIETLNTALSVDELSSNTELLMEQAQIYVQQRDYDHALYAIFLTLYIDPTVEKAYHLKIQIANTRNRPGDAVLAAQDYLYYYPGSTTAFRLLGEARERERKDDLALEAYTQGLAGNSTDVDVQQMLEARAQIYQRQRQYSLAQEDYSRLFQITDESRVQALRMQTAFLAGDYETALSDATALSGTGTSQGIVNLIRGGSLVEQSQPDDTEDLTSAVTALTQASASSDVAFSDWRGVASEYLARAQFGLNDRSAALDSINAALTAGETGSRHYWRGRILEAQNDKNGAINDYEWVVAWSRVFPFPFVADAQDRLDALLASSS